MQNFHWLYHSCKITLSAGNIYNLLYKVLKLMLIDHFSQWLFVKKKKKVSVLHNDVTRYKIYLRERNFPVVIQVTFSPSSTVSNCKKHPTDMWNRNADSQIWKGSENQGMEISPLALGWGSPAEPLWCGLNVRCFCSSLPFPCLGVAGSGCWTMESQGRERGKDGRWFTKKDEEKYLEKTV